MKLGIVAIALVAVACAPPRATDGLPRQYAVKPDVRQTCGVGFAQFAPVDERLRDFETIFAREGGRAAVSKFDCADGYRLIATGNPGAITLAFRLLPYSDAASTEQLYDGVARAMQTNPEAVLAHFDDVPREFTDQFCVPFISNEVPQGPELTLLKRIEMSVGKVTKPDLQEAKDVCLSQLSEAEDASESLLRAQKAAPNQPF